MEQLYFAFEHFALFIPKTFIPKNAQVIKLLLKARFVFLRSILKVRNEIKLMADHV